jgi:hypothetical protein
VRSTLRIVGSAVLKLFVAASVAKAGQTDQQLLQLVPPGAKVIAAINAPAHAGQPGAFLLLTHRNSLDLEDFLALTGVDDSRRIQQVIYVSGGFAPTDQAEHSLLVRGQFDERRIFKAALENGASRREWRGLPVLLVPPFAREKGMVPESRWLVVLEATTAILGTETSVRVELNRAVTGSAPDASLIEMRSHLRADDDAWCIVKALPAKDEIRRSLYVFDPSLPGLLHDGDGFEFGIRYGARVEFEYEVTRADNSTDSISDTVVQPLLEKGKASMIVPRQADGGHIHRLKVSKARYEAWLTEVAASRRAPDLESK